MKLPESVKPIWRTVQLVRITKGLDDGLRLFIVGPFLYDIFKHLSGADTAMLYASIAWSIYFGLIAFLEIPTGVLADVFGRVRAVIACFVCNMIFALGLAGLILFKNVSVVFVVVILISIVRAAAVTFYNGSFYAWMVDSLRECDPDFGYERLIARGYAYHSWSMMVGSILGVTFYLYGVAYVAFVLGAFFCLNGATYCMVAMRESRTVSFANFKNFWGDAGNRMATTLATAFRVCHQVPILWCLLFTFACYTFCLNVFTYLWPIVLSVHYGATKWSGEWYLMALGAPAATALYSQVLSWAGNRNQHATGKKLSTTSLMRWMYASCWFGVFAILALTVFQTRVDAPFLLFAFAIIAFQGINGVVDSCNSALINEYIPHKNSQERATIMSVGSMMKGLMVLVFLVPASMPTHSTTVVGWLLPAGLFAAVLIVAQVYIKRWKRLQTQPNELISVPAKEVI